MLERGGEGARETEREIGHPKTMIGHNMQAKAIVQAATTAKADVEQYLSILGRYH